MRKPQSLRADYAAQIVAAQSTELAVVICGYPRQLKAGLGAGQLNSGSVVMVGVRVTANNTVGAQGLKLQPAYAAGRVGVEYNAAVGGDELEAGVTVPYYQPSKQLWKAACTA